MNQQSEQTRHSFAWGKVAGMLFAVLIPAGLLAASNEQVFPDSSWLATGMVIVTAGIAGIFAVASAYAMPKVKKYVLIASLAVDLALSINLAAHWVLARQVSGARQATVARHEEEDREEKRREAEAQRQIELAKAEADLAAANARASAAEARRLAQLPLSERRARSTPRRSPAKIEPAPVAEPEVKAATTIPAPRLTVEEVMEKWQPWLIALAVLDLLTSVVAFGVCAVLWEWDRDHDGIADHLQGNQQGRAPTLPTRTAPGFVQAQAPRDPKGESNQD